MKTNVISTTLLALTLCALNAVTITAQTKKEMPHDHMMMAHEPQHALAMAYHQNLAAFAKALHDQTAGASSVNVEFARAAVAEMRRSFDQMKQHHQEHMQTMSAEMHSKMSAMMPQMETHQAELNTQLMALEQEVQTGTPDAKKVATLAASVNSHLTAMSKMHQGSMGSMGSKGRKMKI